MASLFLDMVFTAGIYSIVGWEVTPATVIGLLTILGFSIYDTVVVFDRIRENLRLHFCRNGDVNALVNTSVYQTLTRSLYTVFTVLFTTFALYFFGNEAR